MVVSLGQPCDCDAPCLFHNIRSNGIPCPCGGNCCIATDPRRRRPLWVLKRPKRTLHQALPQGLLLPRDLTHEVIGTHTYQDNFRCTDTQSFGDARCNRCVIQPLAIRQRKSDSPCDYQVGAYNETRWLASRLAKLHFCYEAGPAPRCSLFVFEPTGSPSSYPFASIRYRRGVSIGFSRSCLSIVLLHRPHVDYFVGCAVASSRQVPRSQNPPIRARR
jgi:hypothetical protein